VKRILLVEDDYQLRRLITVTLGSHYQVIEAGNRRDGLRLAQIHRPDLVLLDVVMPEMAGYAACSAIKGNTATAYIPVVMLTGRGDPTDIEKGRNAGCDDYVVKSFSPRALLDKVYLYLGE